MKTLLSLSPGPIWSERFLWATALCLLGVGFALMPEAFQWAGRTPLQPFSSSHILLGAITLLAFGLCFLLAYNSRALNRLADLPIVTLSALSLLPVLLPYLAMLLTPLSNMMARPSWPFWLGSDLSFQRIEGSLIAVVLLMFVTRKALFMSTQILDQYASGKDLRFESAWHNLLFGLGIAIWVAVTFHLGKHPLAALAGTLIAGGFWIWHGLLYFGPIGGLLHGLVILTGFTLGGIASLVFRELADNWPLLAFSGMLALGIAYFWREDEEVFGARQWRDCLLISTVGTVFGLSLAMAGWTLWFLLDKGFSVIFLGEELPYLWKKLLIVAGLLDGDRHDHLNYLGFSATQSREILSSADWWGSHAQHMLPHAWDDYMLLEIAGQHGWIAGLASVGLLCAFLYFSYRGIGQLAQGGIRQVGWMMWAFLALSCLINLQANLGLLPGIPFLGQPFLSLHIFLAGFGGLVTGLAQRGFASRQSVLISSDTPEIAGDENGS